MEEVPLEGTTGNVSRRKATYFLTNVPCHSALSVNGTPDMVSVEACRFGFETTIPGFIGRLASAALRETKLHRK